MKKHILGVLMFMMVIGAGTASAQYSTAIGIRGALSPGFTIKHHIDSDVAIEGILVTRWNGIIITGLWEKHFPAFGVENLRWYLGGGAHVGLWSSTSTNNPWFESDGGVVIGLDGIGGLEYTLPDFPLNFSLDWKPGFNLVGHTGFWTDDGALSIRYCF